MKKNEYRNEGAIKFLFSDKNTMLSDAVVMEHLSASKTEVPEWSGFSSQNYGQFSKVSGDTCRTVILPDVLKLLVKLSANQDFSIIKYEENHYACEVMGYDGTYYFCEYASNSGKINIAKLVDPVSGAYSSVSLKLSENFEFTAVYGCLLAYLCDQNIFNFDTLKTELEDNPENTIFSVSATLEDAVRNGYIPITIPKTGRVTQFQQETIEDTIGNCLAGIPKFLNKGNASATAGILTIAELKAEFASYRASGWTPEEQALVPEFADDFPCVPEVRKILRAYTQTLLTPNRLVNFQWTGTSGYGKSTGVKNIACILNMPLLIQTCNPNTETEDFQSTFVPNTDQPDSVEIPVFDRDDMEFDPEGCWSAITAEAAPEKLTGYEVALKYAETIRKNVSKDSSDFRYVLANYTRALEKGYIVEVQESSRIQRQGVLVGLNETAVPGAIIAHMDGTFGTRHPNAIVIYTDNEGLDTCNSQDESVISRFSFKLISDQPSKEFILARLKVATGISDLSILEKAYSDWDTVNTFCRSKMISNGAGIRELTNLVTMVSIEGVDSFLDNLTCCVINKVIPEKADREECRSQFLVND